MYGSPYGLPYGRVVFVQQPIYCHGGNGQYLAPDDSVIPCSHGTNLRVGDCCKVGVPKDWDYHTVQGMNIHYYDGHTTQIKCKHGSDLKVGDCCKVGYKTDWCVYRHRK